MNGATRSLLDYSETFSRVACGKRAIRFEDSKIAVQVVVQSLLEKGVAQVDLKWGGVCPT